MYRRPQAIAVLSVLSVCLLAAHTAARAEEKISVNVKDAPLESVCAMLSKASGTQVVAAQGVTGRRVTDLAVRDATLQQVLLRLCEDLKLKAMWAGDKWVLLDTTSLEPVEGQVECALRVLSATAADLDALFAAHPGPEEQFRLPRGVTLLRSALTPELNRLLAEGRATIVNEPHVVTADGQPAEFAFTTNRDGIAASVPGFRPADFSTSLHVLPQMGEQGQIGVTLSAKVAWSDTNASAEYSLALRLPPVTLAPGQSVLIRGWSLEPDDTPATDRETAIVLSVAPARR